MTPRLVFFRRNLEERPAFHILQTEKWQVISQLRDGRGLATLSIGDVLVSVQGVDEADALSNLENRVRTLWTTIEGMTAP